MHWEKFLGIRMPIRFPWKTPSQRRRSRQLLLPTFLGFFACVAELVSGNIGNAVFVDCERDLRRLVIRERFQPTA
jgi:hypothetical protein